MKVVLNYRGAVKAASASAYLCSLIAIAAGWHLLE